MRLTVRVEVHNQTAAVARQGAGFADALALALAKRAAALARENVAPGKGPGPHPHRPQSVHADTGALRRSIHVRQQRMGFLTTAAVYTDLPYGLFLELGWHSQAGNFYRYAWLYPAILLAQHEAAAIARSTSRSFFSSTGRVQQGRSHFTAPLTGTVWAGGE